MVDFVKLSDLKIRKQEEGALPQKSSHRTDEPVTNRLKALSDTIRTSETQASGEEMATVHIATQRYRAHKNHWVEI